MSSLVHGDNTSEVEVTNISAHGVWLLAHGKEFFMSYEEFPWFRDVSVKSILNVEEVSAGHYHWPDLDIDLTEEIISNPERFTLRASIIKGAGPGK